MLSRPLLPGEHIKISRGVYDHHAIFLGNGLVIHICGGKEDSGTSSAVQVSFLEAFASPSPVSAIDIVEYAQCDAPNDVILRAYSQLGALGWHPTRRNCEHFARWCKTGESKSDQATVATSTVGGVAGGTAATLGAVGVVSAAGVSGLSGAGVLSGLATAGGLLGGGAVAGVALLAGAPAAVATIAAHRALRDDPKMPEGERNARRVARNTSVVGGLVGTAGSIAMISAAGAVPGLSGAGIASGLAALGGSMAGGVIVAVAAPAAVVALFAWGAYRLAKRS